MTLTTLLNHFSQNIDVVHASNFIPITLFAGLMSHDINTALKPSSHAFPQPTPLFIWGAPLLHSSEQQAPSQRSSLLPLRRGRELMLLFFPPPRFLGFTFIPQTWDLFSLSLRLCWQVGERKSLFFLILAACFKSESTVQDHGQRLCTQRHVLLVLTKILLLFSIAESLALPVGKEGQREDVVCFYHAVWLWSFK